MSESLSGNEQPDIWSSIKKKLQNSWHHFQAVVKPAGHPTTSVNTRLIGMLVLGALTVALLLSAFLWWHDRDFRPLYGLGEHYNTAAVVEVLDQQSIDYRVNPDSGQLMVHQHQLPAARMAMASSGIVLKNPMLQQELPQKETLGNSHFMEQMHYLAALEVALSNTIASLSAVRNVRVHLAVPERTIYFREQPAAKASVYLDLYAGNWLTPEQVEAIMRLVSGSVTGLQERYVTVVDQFGNLLSQAISTTLSTGDNAISSRYLAARSQIENHLELQLSKLLDAIIGAGAYRVDVAADLSIHKQETNAEQFGPTTAVRSESIQSDMKQPGEKDQASPAIAETTASQDQQQEPRDTEQKVVRNYEVSRQVSNEIRYPGEIKRLSVAVVIDTHAFKQLPSSQSQSKLTELVKQAVGFDGQRGDEVSIAVLPFTAPPAPEPESLQSWINSWFDVAMKVAMKSALILAMVSMIAMAWLWFYRRLSSPATIAGIPAAGESPKTAKPVHMVNGLERQLAQLRSMALEEPEKAASVLKRWIASGQHHA